MRWLICVGLCASYAAAADEPVSFSKDIAPLLKDHCAPCHLTGDEAGNMALHPKAAYKTLVGAPSIESKLQRVKPSSSQESYLVHKIEGTQLEVGGTGLRMPMEGAYLTDEQIKMIRRWIDAGALDN